MAGTITHKWYGTTLAITSDSGTSMCDLKGEKGDMGVRGPQGAPGIVRNEDGTIDMTAYATETYVDEKVAAIDIDADLSDYFTKSETTTIIQEVVGGYATEEYVQEQINAIPDVNLSDYYTKEEVNAEIVKAQLEGADVDLSAYYTKTETNTAIQNGLNGYATTDYVDEKVASSGGGSGLPTVSTADNGKFLMVVGGVWAAAELPVYNGEYEVM